jgi:hypothetical protein
LSGPHLRRKVAATGRSVAALTGRSPRALRPVNSRARGVSFRDIRHHFVRQWPRVGSAGQVLAPLLSIAIHHPRHLAKNFSIDDVDATHLVSREQSTHGCLPQSVVARPVGVARFGQRLGRFTQRYGGTNAQTAYGFPPAQRRMESAKMSRCNRHNSARGNWNFGVGSPKMGTGKAVRLGPIYTLIRGIVKWRALLESNQ